MSFELTYEFSVLLFSFGSFRFCLAFQHQTKSSLRTGGNQVSIRLNMKIVGTDPEMTSC